jgi:hypothetical protein
MAIEFTFDTPTWLGELIRNVGDLINPMGFIGQLGFRYLSPEAEKNNTKRWLIGIYIVPHELVGGKQDGASSVSGFCLDLSKLLALFDDITLLEWRVPRRYSDGLSGPEIWLEGYYMGKNPVQLHIYADSPADEKPELTLDVSTNVLRVKE